MCNDFLLTEVDQNLVRLYDGVFLNLVVIFDWIVDTLAVSWNFNCQPTNASGDDHHWLLEHSDFILYNITDSVEASDTIRSQIKVHLIDLNIFGSSAPWVKEIGIQLISNQIIEIVPKILPNM